MKNKNFFIIVLLFGFSLACFNYCEAASISVPKITSLKVKQRYVKKIKLQWKNIASAQNYQIRVLRKKNSKFKLKRKIKAIKNKKVVKKLQANTSYYFRVRAKRNNRWGPYSKRVRGKTRPRSSTDSELIQPSDLEYQGAFRLPDVSMGYEYGWHWGGTAATYNPDNDSLIGVGHPFNLFFSEVSIPQPKIVNNISNLNTAKTMQGFEDVLGNLVNVDTLELPRVGIEYYDQKIYFAVGEHFQENNDLTHGYSNVNLNNPQAQGLWKLKNRSPYSTNDYIFITPDNQLASGRFRDGGWSGQGPSLFSYSPNISGNIDNTKLLLYESSEDCNESCNTIDNYHHSDEWVGGAWLETDNKSAIIFAGTKGVGECWYGDEDGECMDCEGDRGWWSTEFRGQIIFYNPNDLDQPYARLNIDDYLFNINSTQQKEHLSAIAYNRQDNYLYLFEYRADDDKPIVHVWKING